MVAGWDLEPGNSLLYLHWELGITLSIHLLFDLQKIIDSVLHGEHGKLMHSIFYLFVAFPSLFVEAPARAGSSSSTRNMQQGLCWKLCPFCSEKRHLPWGEEAVLGVWNVGHTSHCRSGVLGIWGGAEGCRLLPALHVSLARHQGEQEIKLLEAPLPVSPWPFWWSWALRRCCWRRALCVWPWHEVRYERSMFPYFPLVGRKRARALNCLQKTRRASQWPKMGWTCCFLPAHLSGQVFNIVPLQENPLLPWLLKLQALTIRNFSSLDTLARAVLEEWTIIFVWFQFGTQGKPDNKLISSLLKERLCHCNENVNNW